MLLPIIADYVTPRFSNTPRQRRRALHPIAAQTPSIFSSKNEPGEPVSDMRVSFL
jgi:hypothetical protein